MDPITVNQWLKMANRNTTLLINDYSGLSDTLLGYTVHINKCSIREVLDNLICRNDFALDCIQKNRPIVNTGPAPYTRNVSGLLLLRLARRMNCRKGIHGNLHSVEILIQQQEQLKSFLQKYKTMDLNKRTIWYNLFLKVSAGNMFEYMLELHKTHFLLVRRILMLQNL